MLFLVALVLAVAVVLLVLHDRLRQQRLEFFVRIVVAGADRPLHAFEIRDRLERLYDEVVDRHEVHAICRRLVVRGVIAHAAGPNGYERYQAVPRRESAS